MEPMRPAQQPNTTPIPFYRTRWFWGVVVGAMVLWGIFFYLSTFPSGQGAFDTYKFISLAFGSGLFTFLGLNIGGEIGEVLSTLLYTVTVIFLTYKTFSFKKVKIFYPAGLIVIYAIGTLLTIQLIAGLG